MPRLPVRDLSDVQLADAFDAPGCPICRRATVSVDRYVALVLGGEAT